MASARAPLAGTWRGRYRSEKAAPTLAPTVQDAAWKKDDGAHGSGEGELTVTVDDEGAVTGRIEGPLGPADLQGVSEGSQLSATLTPRGDDERAFSGVLEATSRDGSLEVSIRAADGAARTVRSAKATLRRAPP